MFDKAKYQLGSLCKCLHKYEGTSNSLRYIVGNSCVECTKIYHKNYYKINKISLDKKHNEYINDNKDDIGDYRKKYYDENIEKMTKYQQNYRNNHHKDLSQKRREYENKKYTENINYRLTKNLRRRIQKALHGISKTSNTLELLGCNLEQLHEHLESTFTKGMCWENYGEWHIDHKIPFCAFNLQESEQQKIVFNYKNTQALWEKDNLTKIKKDLKLNWRKFI